MAKKYYSIVNRPDKKEFYEKTGGKVLVESQGHIPIQHQILRIIDAGQRLEQSRREMYDYDSKAEITEEELNGKKATRLISMSKMDAIQAQKALAERFAKHRKEREKRLKEQSDEREKSIKEKLEKLEKIEQMEKSKQSKADQATSQGFADKSQGSR